MGARKTVMGDIGVTNGRTLKFQAHHAIRIGFQKLKKDVGIEILKNVPLCLRLWRKTGRFLSFSWQRTNTDGVIRRKYNSTLSLPTNRWIGHEMINFEWKRTSSDRLSQMWLLRIVINNRSSFHLTRGPQTLSFPTCGYLLEPTGTSRSTVCDKPCLSLWWHSWNVSCSLSLSLSLSFTIPRHGQPRKKHKPWFLLQSNNFERSRLPGSFTSLSLLGSSLEPYSGNTLPEIVLSYYRFLVIRGIFNSLVSLYTKLLTQNDLIPKVFRLQKRYIYLMYTYHET